LAGELVALLTNEMLPGTLPAACGAKVTVKVTLVPDCTVVGKVIPVTEYPVPFQAADETETSALLAVSVPVRFLVLPTFTLPKDNVDGDSDNCAAAVAVPFPCRGTIAGSVAPTTSIVNVPVAAPLVVGLNETVRSVLCPAVNSIGTVAPDEKPAPLALT